MLGTTLESVKQRFGRMGLEVSWHGTGQVLLPSDVLDAFLLALAECLENVRRHSGVTEAHVTITDDETTVRAMITDSGVGFDLDDVDSARLGLKESVVGRLKEVGGRARLFSSPGSGTTVVLEVPGMAEMGARMTFSARREHPRRGRRPRAPQHQRGHPPRGARGRAAPREPRHRVPRDRRAVVVRRCCARSTVSRGASRCWAAAPTRTRCPPSRAWVVLIVAIVAHARRDARATATSCPSWMFGLFLVGARRRGRARPVAILAAGRTSARYATAAVTAGMALLVIVTRCAAPSTSLIVVAVLGAVLAAAIVLNTPLNETTLAQQVTTLAFAVLPA